MAVGSGRGLNGYCVCVCVLCVFGKGYLSDKMI